MRLGHLFMLFILAAVTSLSANAASLSFIYGWHSYDAPLLIQTVDQGKNWVNQNLPFEQGSFSTGACADTVCIAVGRNYDNGSDVVLKTHDSGANWSVVDFSDTPGMPSRLHYEYSACSDSLCVILPYSGYDDSVILQSTDSGNSWSIAYNDGNVIYSDVDCIDDYCVAVGVLNHNYPGFYPVLIQTQDAGATWTQISLPTNSKGQIYAVDCSSTLCTAVGYEGTSPFESSGPLILQSKDKGITWTKMAITAGEQATDLFEVKCTDAGCVAIGNGRNALVIADNLNKQSYQGFGVVSADWLNGVDCNDAQCYVVGGSERNKYKNLLLGNLGGNWHSIKLPENATSGILDYVSCDNSFCFATGSSNDTYFMIQNTKGSDWKSVKLKDFSFKKINYIAGGVASSR